MTHETAILHCALFDDRALPFLRHEAVQWSDFADPRNATLFASLCKIATAGQPVDPVNLGIELRRTGSMDQAGGMAYLSEITDAVVSVGHLEYYLGQLRDARLRREIARLGADLSAMASADPADRTTAELVAMASERVAGLADRREKSVEFADVVDEEAARWARLANGAVEPVGLPVGLPGLDDALQGLQGGKLYVMAGRPSAGKTTMEGQISRHVALHHGLPVYRVSRDSSPRSLARRELVAMNDGLTIHGANEGKTTPEQLAAMDAARATIRAAKITLDTRTRHLEDMILNIRMAKARHGIRLVTVDYAQIVEVRGLKGRAADDERRVIAHVCHSFKSLAHEIDVPILLLAQLSRGAENDDGIAPRMKDLLGSGALEQDADAIMFLYRSIKFDYESPYFEPARDSDGAWLMQHDGRGGLTPRLETSSPKYLDFGGPIRPITLQLAKNKDGTIGEWPLWLDAGYFRFRESWPNHGQVPEKCPRKIPAE